MKPKTPRTLANKYFLFNLGQVGRVFPFPDDTDFKITCFNDLDILPDGRLVVSESSTRFPLDKLLEDLIEGHSSGR